MSTTPTTHELHVKGMSCQHCVKGVTRAVQAQDASAEVRIDLSTGKVLVTSGLALPAVRQAIEEEGYEVLA